MSALVALVALLGIAPWAIYVGSLAKYTEFVNANRIFDQG